MCVYHTRCRELWLQRQKLLVMHALRSFTTLNSFTSYEHPPPSIIYMLYLSIMQVIAAEGEQKSSKALKEASDIIAQSPAALQLRYLQVG